jgi:hypothetical protein
MKKSQLIIYIFIIAIITSGCASSEKQKSDPVHEECFSLDKISADLHLKALGSGELGSDTSEWAEYNKAKDRFKVLNCRYWFTLSYQHP